MTVRVLATFVGIWLAFAFVGGIADGQIIGGHDPSGSGAHTGDAATLQEAGQLDVGQEESSGGVLGFFGNIARGLSATISFLFAWAGMLALNFSFFTGEWAIVGWFVRGIIGIPMITMLLLSLR